MDNLSKQLESTKSQKTSASQSHSFILKKRTPEEGSKAIYRMAVIAAIGSKDSRCSSSNIPRTDGNSLTLALESSHVKTQMPSPSIKPKNKSNGNTVQEDQWSPPQVFEETEGQGDSSELKKDNRVSQQTPENVPVVLFRFLEDGDYRIKS